MLHVLNDAQILKLYSKLDFENDITPRTSTTFTEHTFTNSELPATQLTPKSTSFLSICNENLGTRSTPNCYFWWKGCLQLFARFLVCNGHLQQHWPQHWPQQVVANEEANKRLQTAPSKKVGIWTRQRSYTNHEPQFSPYIYEYTEPCWANHVVSPVCTVRTFLSHVLSFKTTATQTQQTKRQHSANYQSVLICRIEQTLKAVGIKGGMPSLSDT